MAFKKNRTATRRATTRTATKRTQHAKGGRPWSRQEIAFLRKNYRTNATKWVARQLGRTAYSVRYKASSLSIKKAKPSVWRANTRTNRPTQQRWTSAPKTRWARTPRRQARKASPRKAARRNRF
ncbi:MAG: hypothetical protein WAU88_12255 [Candidatus Zixiibacteriota bacterium]